MASNTEHLNLLKKDPVADGNEYFNIETMLNENWDKIDEAVGNVQNRLNRSSTEFITLQPGLQTINAKRDARFKLGEVRGRTLINILGSWGGCESLNPRYFYNRVNASIDTTIKKSGSASLKVVADTSTDTTHYYRFAGSVVEDCYRVSEGEYILFGAWIKPQSAGAHMTLFFWNETGTENVSGIIGGSVIYDNPTKFTYGYVKAKVPPGARYVVPRIALVDQNGNENFTGTGAEGCNIDEVSIYKLSEAEYAALDGMTSEEIADKYPFVSSGIVGVENPYAIATSGNLLPPFYEWTAGAGITSLNIKEPYEVEATFRASSAGTAFQSIVSAIPEQEYALSWDVNDRGTLWVGFIDRSGVQITAANIPNKGTFITPQNTSKITVAWYEPGGGTIKLKNPMLTFSEAKLFESQRRSILAFQTELHANPTDLSDPDVLFEWDGQYFKLMKWKKIVLNGSMDWTFGNNYSNGQYKSVNLPISGQLKDSASVTKFNGVLLERRMAAGGIWDKADMQLLSENLFSLTISIEESGWGSSYTPSVDEIKAYFWGWTMCNQNGSVPYVGTGTKYWKTINKPGVADTSTLPTTQAPNRTSYQLLYRLAKEIVEPVTVEGCLTLAEGDNLVDVGTGIVLRESVKPKQHTNTNWIINNTGVGTSLSSKAAEIIAIYRDSGRDHKWIKESVTGAWGTEQAYIFSANYDQSAAYSVTYTKLDTFPIQPISGSLAANEKAQINNLTTGVAEALHRVSVIEQKKTEKDAPSLQWITPTLLNGWTSNHGMGYKKIGSLLLFKGTIEGGSVGALSAFILPQGYRPKANRSIGVLSRNTSQVYAQGRITIYPSGEFTVDVGPNGTVFLDGIIIEAEQ
ncbi:hypothetical protein [Paenibacillus woosongensis]|uniref:Uncharacterized protein n=1 Tax=Paenibacillus woosongensis TaxID=307580 RepID=A0A7X3CMI0_9BACL|nr:hypothetical protein [Paenibacillus woosongensis]MUG45235.1 hypothetical protein [Paenibacillus woosongensis]